MSSQTSQGLTPPMSRGFSAVPSVDSSSAFVGIDGTAKNNDITVLAFLGSRTKLLREASRSSHPKKAFLFRLEWQKQSCSVSTTATNRHNCLSSVCRLDR